MANSEKILFFIVKGAKRELFAFVVCARSPLGLCQSASQPLMPFLIRDDVSHGWQVTPAEYRQVLWHKQSVEVHDLGLESPAQGPPSTIHMKPDKLFELMKAKFVILMEQQGDPGIREQEIGRALRKTNWNWTGINVFELISLQNKTKRQWECGPSQSPEPGWVEGMCKMVHHKPNEEFLGFKGDKNGYALTLWHKLVKDASNYASRSLAHPHDKNWLGEDYEGRWVKSNQADREQRDLPREVPMFPLNYVPMRYDRTNGPATGYVVNKLTEAQQYGVYKYGVLNLPQL
ncbi:hypothetical protein LTR99_009906 [Exophiala xenobiotica]|nr:hypothetical protein LTR96_010021 [Exophiala xenobiotica]KAK5293459.1 hypothetical protein LTR99_009906 [Exophiala xenobiotica]KAK5333553.1 hypothetical protein LTR98_010253 [Exophiala xenobiotica]KAK5408780.1 hypothetical protein LTR90_009398 [Exophiala xenobiotica]KAK5455678.1 hypothetical protein LTR20_009584 [Exophiala xenobiotica]